MNKNKIIFWIATGIVFFWCGVMTVIFFGSEESKAAMEHYGYPPYFCTDGQYFQYYRAVVLVLPAVPARLKEWAHSLDLPSISLAQR